MTERTPKLLVVDDDPRLRDLLRRYLGENGFQVFVADNGVTMNRLWLRERFDALILDLMMPGEDGLQILRRLREQKDMTPIIMLTARGEDVDRIVGLEMGADDYIPKPFNLDILTVKMHNLVEARRSLQQPLREPNVPIEPSRITVTSLDEKLLKRVMDDVEANISNPDFSVEELSRDVGMSRVNLYKKLLSITGKTPIEFIRLVRLKRAAQLLRESQMNVSEVAYEVGFNNPKYFRKYFKDEFGVLPSQFEKKDDNTN